MTIKQFKQLEIDRFKADHPTMPYAESFFNSKFKYNDKTANGLTQLVIRYIKFIGGQAERISTTGRPIDGTKVFQDAIGRTRMIGSVTWIPGTGRKGSADVSATIRGKSVKVEIKIGRDRQSDNQKEYQAEIERAGGTYFIATSFEQITNQIEQI